MKILMNQKILILIPGLLILWKFLLFIDLPYPNYDGPWALSHTFSVLRGQFLESTFAYDFWVPYQLPPAYGFLSGLFFLILHPLSNVYSIFIYNIVLITMAIILSNTYLNRKSIKSYPLKLIIFVSLLTTTDIYNQRYELLNINLLLLLLILLDVNYKYLSNMRIAIISFLIATIGLIHPVGGFFAVCLSISIAVNRKFNIVFYIKNYLFVILL